MSLGVHAAVVGFVDRIRDLADTTDEGGALIAATELAVETLANAIVNAAVAATEARLDAALRQFPRP